MNAAAQRRVTPVLAGIALVLALIFATLFAGVGRGVHWNPPLPTPPLPEVRQSSMPVPLPLDHFSAVWLHPLFNPDRKPVLHNAGETSNLGDMELTGIIITPTLRVALLRNKDDANKPPSPPGSNDNKDDGSRDVRVREGATLPDGSWKLVELQPRVAIFESAGTRSELKLPSGAPVTPLPNQNKNAPPMPGQPNPAATPNSGDNAPQMQIRHLTPGAQQVPPPGAVPGQPPSQADQAERIRQLRENILKRRAQQAATPEGVR